MRGPGLWAADGWISCWRATCCVLGWHNLEAVEEGEELVGGTVASGLGVERRGAGERSFLDGEIGMNVKSVGGFDPVMPEPQRDHRDVHAAG